MVSSKTKALVYLFAVVLFVGIATVGCKSKPKSDWVNTASMPGHAFDKNYSDLSNAKNARSSMVYLGDPNAPNVQFGPKDVSFNFRDLH